MFNFGWTLLFLFWFGIARSFASSSLVIFAVEPEPEPKPEPKPKPVHEHELAYSEENPASISPVIIQDLCGKSLNTRNCGQR